LHKNDFINESKQRIVTINSVTTDDDGLTIRAIMTVSQFGRITQKPYTFTLDEWSNIINKRCIE